MGFRSYLSSFRPKYPEPVPLIWAANRAESEAAREI